MLQFGKSVKAVVRLAALALLGFFGLAGQSLKYLTPQEEAFLKGEISGDAAYEHLRHNTQFHRPRGGAEGLMEVARYYEQKAREYGLADVRLIKQKATYPAWNARFAELWMVDPAERIASTVQTPLHLLDNSRPVEVTAELIDVGDGSNEKDYEGKQVEGKIVLAWGGPAAVMKEAVSKRNAAGLVLRPDPRSPRWFSRTCRAGCGSSWSASGKSTTWGPGAECRAGSTGCECGAVGCVGRAWVTGCG